MPSPRRTALTAALTAAALLACSCFAQDGPPVCSEMRALVNGDPQPPPELGSVSFSVIGLRVRRQVGGQFEEQVCSGVRIDDQRVLTAAHCFKSDRAAEIVLSMGQVLPETDDCAPLVAQNQMDSASHRLHPQRDVAVVTTHASFGVATPVCGSPPQSGIPGIVAGYGLDENASLGKRRFLFTRVVSVSDDAIEVRATTEAGACVGDSGGPLFVEQNGAWCVAGILSTGSASCRASDRYVPLSPLEGWLR